MYPVYSSKLHSGAKLPLSSELDSLCLSCASHLCQSLSSKALGALCHCLPNAGSEVASFYSPLYDQKKAAAITAAMPARASEAYNARIMGCAQTLLWTDDQKQTDSNHDEQTNSDIASLLLYLPVFLTFFPP
jgi:hypothetical protein